MSLPLLHSPCDVVQQLLIDLSAGTDPDADPLGDWPVYSDEEPDGDGIPDEVVTVYDTDGIDDGHGHVDGYAYTHHGLLVRVRAADFDRGKAKAYEVRRLLNESVVDADVTVEDSLYVVHAVKASPVRRMGRELGKSRRHLWTVNGTAAITPQATPSPPPPPPGHVVELIADDLAGDGVAQATCAGPHGLSDLDPVTISGNSVSAYNGAFLAGLQSDDPTTQFWLLDPNTTTPIVNAGTGTGGTWI